MAHLLPHGQTGHGRPPRVACRELNVPVFAPSSLPRLLRRGVVVLLGLVSFLAMPHPVDAQYFGQNKVRYRAFDFLVLETPHFDLYYYPSETEAARQAAVLAERWYDRISKALDHQLSKRQPLVVYDSQGDFRQTNVVHGILDEATGGVTEGMRNRMVLPIGPTLADTNHVIGHELVHAFQYDIARQHHSSILMMPLWFIEGMAEYYSVAPAECQTAMWMRDAVRQGKLPTIADLSSGRYFPYRYGHALWNYLAARFGDGVVVRMLKAGSSKLDRRFVEVTGVTMAQLTTDWHASLRAAYPAAPPAPQPDTRCLLDRSSGGRLNIAPALSPRGDRLAYLSERNDFAIELYVMFVSTNGAHRKVLSRAGNPRLDSVEFIESSGAWSPDNRHLAVGAVKGGVPELLVLDVDTGECVREVRFPELRQVRQPSWSPDGSRLAFSGVQGGWSDLFSVEVTTGRVTRWTSDAYSELQPAWSPDGRSIVFVTDRFSTSLTSLTPGPFRLALLDVASGRMEELPGTSSGRNISPQWLPGGGALLFVSDQDGVPNVYRLDLATRLVSRITKVNTGVAGITAMSPAMSVAARSPVVAYTIYKDGGYQIHTLNMPDPRAGVPGLPAPDSQPSGTEPARLSDSTGPRGALHTTNASAASVPATVGFRDRPYRRRLSLSGLAEPCFVAGGGPLGGYFRVGMGMSFSDMLGDREVALAVQGGRRLDDFASQLAYVNRSKRVNWGVSLQYLPARFARSESATALNSQTLDRTTTYETQQHLGIYGLVVYPIDQSRRLEFTGGFRQVVFGHELSHQVVTLPGNQVQEEQRRGTSAPGSLRMMESSAAYVVDTAVLGGASPILGHRYRFEVSPSVGSVSLATVLADVRHYVIPMKPFTLAVRGRYTGRFGRGADDPRLLPLVLTLRDQARGYDLANIAAEACGNTPGVNCSVLGVLTSSRLFAGNIELRAPLLGLRHRTFDYGPLPMELFLFADAASLRTRALSDSPRWQGQMLRSAGAGVRINAAGMVFELAAAHPFDRPGRGWTFAFNLGPGF